MNLYSWEDVTPEHSLGGHFRKKIYGRIPGRTGGLIHHTKRDIVGVARRTCLGGHQIPKNIYKFHRIFTKCPPMTVW